MPPQTSIRYYSCVSEKCKVEGNHCHTRVSVLMIPNNGNYLDIETKSGEGITRI